MDLKQINKALADAFSGKAQVVADDEPKDYWQERYQGTESVRTTVYDVGDGNFLKITRQTDSYGNEESVTSVSFVKPTTKQVTDYENI